MKKLIIYDASCPMCRVYTKGMVAANSAAGLGRVSSAQLTDGRILNRLDRQRARHEIPLVDLNGGETLYGIDAWLYTFEQTNRQFARLFSLRWLRLILQKVYAFVSYNRRIIITSAPGRWQLLDLQPDFQPGYRLAFVLMVLGIVGGLFHGIDGGYESLFTLLIAQLLVVAVYIRVRRLSSTLETMLDYSGHLGMSLLVGGLFIRTAQLINWPILLPIGYALMIGQHFIRSYRLGLNPWLSVWFTALLFALFHLF